MLPLGQDCQEIISEDTANPFTSQVIYLNERFCFTHGWHSEGSAIYSLCKKSLLIMSV